MPSTLETQVLNSPLNRGNSIFDGQIDWIKWYGSAGAPPSGPVQESPDYEMDLYISPPSR